MSRVLVFGAQGQLGYQLVQDLEEQGFEVIGLDRLEGDLTSKGAISRAFVKHQPSLVFNAAAYNAVDQAEQEIDQAIAINGVGPGLIAAACREHEATMVHFSTDYVFGHGHEQPIDETREPAPLGAYGRTKLSGERAVLAAHPGAAILRTTRVFAAHGVNWVRSMLRAAETRPELRVVADQISGPTAAHDIAATLLVVARARARGAGEGGVFHYCAAPLVSMLDFTREMFRLADWAAQPTILASRTADWPTPAQRPLTPLMDCRKIAAVYGVPQPDWRPALARVLAELKESRE